MNDAGGNYVFEPGDLTFITGETVQFNLSSENEFHSLGIKLSPISEQLLIPKVKEKEKKYKDCCTIF